MSKGGRPMIEGVVRYANNKINYAEMEKRISQEQKQKGENDAGNPSPRIARERALFSARCFKGGGQAQHAGDSVGQLWLVGMLDVPELDETKLLNAAREWWRAREIVLAETDGGFNIGSKVGAYERRARSGSKPMNETKADKLYRHYSSFLLDASDYERDCLLDLMTPDVDGVPCEWARRIVQTEVCKYFVMPVKLFATDRDYAMLEAAKAAMVAMAGVEARRRAA